MLTKARFLIMAALICNLHIAQIAQGWQSDIIQILKQHTSEV